MQQSGANPAKLSPAEAGRILTECRNAFSAETTPVVDRLFASLDSLLESRLLVELDGEMRKVLLAAQLACREKRNVIAMRFRDCFLKVFEKTLAGLDAGLLEGDGGELTLVDDDVIEEDLVSRHAEWLITDVCAEELKILDRRMPVLTNVIEATRHPLSPRCVMQALRDACGDAIPDPALRLQLFKSMDSDAVQAFQPAYKTASEYIAERVPEPRMRAMQNPPTARATAVGAQALPALPAAGAAIHSPSAGAPLANAPLALAGAAPGGAVSPVSHELLAKLDRLIERHQENHPELASATPQISPTSGVSIDLESLLHRFAVQAAGAAQPSTHNLVRDIKSSTGDTALPAAESIIIDVIAMMFDYIFDDEDIAAPIKGVVGRLQMPVLKIALTDKTFFSNKRHPARALVDRLAELAGECAQDSPEEKRLFEQFGQLADAIQSAPEGSIQAFETALQSLAELSRPNEESSREEALRISRSVTQAEEAAARKKTIRHGLAEKLAGRSVPMSVSRFVLNQWVDYIVLLKERQTPPEKFKALDDSLDDLLWSVAPKHSVGELALLTRRIPLVLETVNACLEAVNAFPHERQVILESLRTTHLDNLKRQAQPAAAAVAETPPEPPPAPEEDPPLPDNLPENLLKGALFDFTQEEGTIRARLNWISPSRRKFVFTSHAMPAFGLSAEELAEELETKRATIVKQGSPLLMERVVEQAIHAVEK